MSRNSQKNSQFLSPIIYIPKYGTIFWEFCHRKKIRNSLEFFFTDLQKYLIMKNSNVSESSDSKVRVEQLDPPLPNLPLPLHAV